MPTWKINLCSILLRLSVPPLRNGRFQMVTCEVECCGRVTGLHSSPATFPTSRRYPRKREWCCMLFKRGLRYVNLRPSFASCKLHINFLTFKRLYVVILLWSSLGTKIGNLSHPITVPISCNHAVAKFDPFQNSNAPKWVILGFGCYFNFLSLFLKCIYKDDDLLNGQPPLSRLKIYC